MSHRLDSRKIDTGARRPNDASAAGSRARRRNSAAVIAAALCFGSITLGPTMGQAEENSRLSSSVGLASPSATPSSTKLQAGRANFVGEPASNEAREVADWVVQTVDNGGLPFIIVDKKDAKVFVFDGFGRVRGAIPALLGLARGDDSAPGIGTRKLSEIRPEERTTPAGRYVASLGQDLDNREVLWVDYGAALALHRVLSANSKEGRLQRLSARSPLAHRITFGCINVPVDFYDKVVHPAFSRTNGIVYIMPEVKTLSQVFFNSNS